MTDDAAYLAADAADRRAALAAAVDLACHRDDVHVRDSVNEDGDAQYVPPEHVHWLSLADAAYHWLRERPSVPAATPADLAVISGQLGNIDTKLEKIAMSQSDIDAATSEITSIVTDVQAQITQLGTDFTAIQTEIANLNSAGVDTSALDAAVAQAQSTMSGLDPAVAQITSLAPSSAPAASTSGDASTASTPAS
jgi:hypothetical protein